MSLLARAQLIVCLWFSGLFLLSPTLNAEVALLPYTMIGDAIPAPLGDLRGDADRGRALALDRAAGNCLICHKAPVANEPFQGGLGPDLTGVGSRLALGQLRLRLVDQSQLDPATLMPSYYRVANLQRVAERYRGQPVFTAQQIEDVVAWLTTLKDQGRQ